MTREKLTEEVRRLGGKTDLLGNGHHGGLLLRAPEGRVQDEILKEAFKFKILT